ncbi:hypothetical protein NE237_010139 [Protea cynaroides]|uniref:Uncharacterized protein n=1 Tax=Protea cynaroides TaxID=273540 RepID=A0A9Q0KZV9_9MAGN|nr:hypothetical protein NE237_010139 [Protea cynaroides]
MVQTWASRSPLLSCSDSHLQLLELPLDPPFSFLLFMFIAVSLLRTFKTRSNRVRDQTSTQTVGGGSQSLPSVEPSNIETYSTYSRECESTIRDLWIKTSNNY